MKVSIDSILNTAIDMKKKNNINDDSLKNNEQDVKIDSVEIKNRVTSRISNIQIELKNLQSSLTKNQIINEGILLLKDDFENGNGKVNKILDQTQFENKHVLNDFLNNDINYNNVLNSSDMVLKLIEKDIASIKGLQVEIENIVASNLVDSDISDTVSGIENSLLNIKFTTLNKISGLNPEMVLGLIR